MTDKYAGSGDDGSDYRPNLGPPSPGESPGSPAQPGPGVPPPPPTSPYQPSYGPPASTTTQDSKALASLVTGGLSLIFVLFCGFLSIPLGIAAIVLGVQARRRTRAAGTSGAMGTIGLILGVVALLLTVTFTVIFALMSSGS